MGHIGIGQLLSLAMYGNRAFFVMLCVVVVVLSVEISLVRTYNYTGAASINIFIVTVFTYIIGQYYILEFVGRKTERTTPGAILRPVIHKIIRIVQYVLSVLLVSILLQIIISSFYYTALLTAVITISYALAVFMLLVLAWRFFSWFKATKNRVLLLYALASFALSVNAALAVAFVATVLQDIPFAIRPNLNEFYYLAIPGSLQYSLNSAYALSSIISFLLTWTATALLLSPYSRRLGGMKHWIIVCLPLVYFLSQFPSFSLSLFSTLINSDPVVYGKIFIVVFILSKAAGGILFGVAFWTMARTVSRENIVRRYLIIAAVGFVLLFVSEQAVVLVNAPYPPLGLASVSFMGLASYLMLIGIYYSGVSISHDSNLRRSIRIRAREEAKLLDTIGMAQMEQEIQKKVLSLSKENQGRITEETGIQPSLSEEDMKQYLEQVIKEIEKEREGKK